MRQLRTVTLVREVDIQTGAIDTAVDDIPTARNSNMAESKSRFATIGYRGCASRGRCKSSAQGDAGLR